jgi:DNA primase
MTPYLVEMIGQTVALKRNGKRYLGLCPFHAEKTPSFQVWDNGRKWRWHCHGCGATGDDIEWLRRTRNLTYPQARASLNLPAITPQQRSASEQALKEKRRRAAAVNAYRDTHPHCCIPDWLLAV